MRCTCLLLAASAAVCAQPIVIDCEFLRLEIGGDGGLVSLSAPCSEAELGRPGEPIAYATVGGERAAATAAAADGARITLSFGDSGVAAVLAWEEVEGMAVVTLESVTGAPEQLDLLCLPLAEGGERLCYSHAVRAADEATVALVAESQDCRIHADRTPRLYATVSSEVSLGPVTVALTAAPWDEIADRLQQAEELFGIPVGVKAKLSDAARRPYLMIGGVSAENADRVIDWAERGGFGSILLLHGTWGHFGRHYEVPESLWPGGVEQLRETVDRIHQAGMLAGAHMFSSKVPKSCAYNEGTAERRLWEDLHLTLAEPIDAQADRIVTAEPPADWPVTAGTRDIRIDGELMAYTSLSVEQPFGFTGLRRALYGTEAQPHDAGAEVAHVRTDESRGIFIIDQTTDLLAEHASDIARTYNAAGFDWIYFDGAEDVHPPRWWTTSNAQMAVIERLDREPQIVQMAASSPFSWHLMTRRGQRDYFWVSMSYKDEVDDAIEHSWPQARRDLMVADLGWFPLRSPREHVRATQIDDVEYLCARALASDSAYSIQTRADRMESVPCLDAMLHVMSRYEHHKFAGTFPQELKDRILQPRQDWMLIERADEEPRLARVREIPYVGGTSHLVRAFVTLGSHQGVTTVSLAPVGLDATARFSLDPRRIEFTDYRGEPHEVEVLAGAQIVVPVTTRVLMHCDGISPGEIRMALRRARCEVIKPPMLLLDAGEPARIEGAFTTAADAELSFDGAIGGALVPSGGFNMDTGPQTWAEYELELPEAGRWYLWIRARYHDTNSNSFFLWDPDHPEQPVCLGNRIGTYHEWLWEGPVGLDLPAGPSVLRITGRESRPLESPVLDVIALVHDERNYEPTDGDARRALLE